MRHEQFDHGPLVESWLKEPTFLTDTDLARVSRLVHETPQRSSWLPRLRDTRFKTMISATAMAAGVAAIALTGSALLNGLAPQGPTPDQLPAAATDASVAALPSPTAMATEPESTGFALPEAVPTGAKGGTIDTPAGPARWVSASGAIDELPSLGIVVPWGDELAIWDGNARLADGRIGRLWSTLDGIDWDEVALPDDYVANDSKDLNVQLAYVDGVHYLTLPRLDRIWRSDGDGGWVRLDTEALAEARPKGWSDGDGSIAGPVLVGDALVFRANYTYTLPRRKLGLTPKRATSSMHRLDRDRYALCRESTDTCSEDSAPKILRFKETDGGLVVRDDRSGERLGLVDGADATQLYEGQNAIHAQTFVLRGDTLVAVDELPGWTPREKSEPVPPDGPVAGDRQPVPDGWVAIEFDRNEHERVAGWHMHTGGGWVDLAPMDLPQVGLRNGRYAVGGVDGATVIWVGDYAADPSESIGIWVLSAPEGP